VLQVLDEIRPTRIRSELAVAGLLVEVPPRGVQGRHTRIPAAGQVDRRQVQRQAQQVVPQSLGHEFVDRVAHLSRQAAHDRAGRLVRGRAAGRKLQRIKESLDQADFAGDEVRIQPVDRLRQHRVAKAVDHVSELSENRRIDGVIKVEERVDIRLDGPRKLLEHQVLVLHFRAELRRLEQPLAVPHQGRWIGWNGGNGSREPLIEKGDVAGLQDHVLDVAHQPVVLAVEDVVDGGQGDVLVHPAVSGDIVRVQQFVVVEARRDRPASYGVRIGRQARTRDGRVRDIVQKGVARLDGVRQTDGRRQVALEQEVVDRARQIVRPPHHHLRQTVRTAQEAAVRIGGQQRHAQDVRIRQRDP